MKRYREEVIHLIPDYLEEHPDGEWVKAEDALEALARLKAWMEIMAYVAPEHLQERLLAEYALTRAFLEEAEA